MRHTPYSWLSYYRHTYIVLYFSSFQSRSRSVCSVPLVVFLPPTLPVFVFLFDRSGGREVLFLLMLYDLFSCFRSGNKLLSWPKTNCVVKVLLAGTILALFLYKGLCPDTDERGIRRHKKHTKACATFLLQLCFCLNT